MPAVGSSEDVGIIPEKFTADIELRGVNFAFPSRPDNAVSGVRLRSHDFHVNVTCLD